MPSVMSDLTTTMSQRAKSAIERMGSELLSSRTGTSDLDIDRLGFELRVVLQRILILDRVGMLGADLTWEKLLDMDLERQLFHVEQLPKDRIWSGDWVGLVRREFGLSGGKWFDEIVELVRGDSVEMGAVDESLMGWVARIEDGQFVLVAEDDSDRKVGGVFYTPASVVGYVLDRALSPAIDGCGKDVNRLLGLRVCDPACGCGYFLIESARRISAAIEVAGGGDRYSDVIRGCVFGGDVNRMTVEVCRWLLWLEVSDRSISVDELRRNVVCGDGLVDEDTFGKNGNGGFDVVVGNPPFLNQLGSGTARSAERVKRLRKRGLVGGAAYTDEASAFFVLGLGMVGGIEEQKERPPPSAKTQTPPPEARGRRKIGRVCMVQPQSVVATRGGAFARARVAEMGSLESLWVSNEHVFGDASVYTCAPCVVVGGEGETRSVQRPLPDGRGSLKSGAGVVRRFSGGGFVEHEPLVISSDEIGGLATWSSIAAVTMGVPEIGIESAGVVGDMATATADFRDEYYGLVGKLVEDSDCRDLEGSPAVLTTGLVDLGVNHWGRKATRIHKERWESPRVGAAGIVGDARLSKWVAARRVEKVVVATQTKVVEAFVDATGEFVVLTPMISVMFRNEDMQEPKTAPTWHPEKSVWMIGAAIGSPVCSAFAMRFFGGAAMHADALKMSARQVMELPLPADGAGWSAGAEAFERVHSACGDEYDRAITEFGEVMCGAYGVEGDDLEGLMGWWLGRLGIG